MRIFGKISVTYQKDRSRLHWQMGMRRVCSIQKVPRCGFDGNRIPISHRLLYVLAI